MVANSTIQYTYNYYFCYFLFQIRSVYDIVCFTVTFPEISMKSSSDHWACHVTQLFTQQGSSDFQNVSNFLQSSTCQVCISQSNMISHSLKLFFNLSHASHSIGHELYVLFIIPKWNNLGKWFYDQSDMQKNLFNINQQISSWMNTSHSHRGSLKTSMYSQLQFKIDEIDKYVPKLKKVLEMSITPKWIAYTILKMKTQNKIPPV